MAPAATRARRSREPVDFEALQDKAYETPDDLTDEEKLHLHNHNMLPEGVQPPPITFLLPDGQRVSNDQRHFENVVAEGSEEFERRVEERAKAIAQAMVREEMRANQGAAQTEYMGNAMNQREGGGTPVPGVSNEAAGDEGDSAEDDYNNWKTDELRAELSARGLDVQGNKKDLVARLEEDDVSTVA